MPSDYHGFAIGYDSGNGKALKSLGGANFRRNLIYYRAQKTAQAKTTGLISYDERKE